MLTQYELKCLLHYDPLTGIFSRIDSDIEIGAVTKTKNGAHPKYYRVICRGKARGYAHRLAFLYMTGSIPDEVDHIDGDSLNNKWVNLRPATTSQNHMNRKILKGVVGLRGVVKAKSGRYIAQIKKDGKYNYLGTFANKEDASEAYKQKAVELFGEFARVE